jgi:hypothetical protein
MKTIEWDIKVGRAEAKFHTMTLDVVDHVDDDLEWSTWSVMSEDAEGVEPIAEGFADNTRQACLMAENVAYATMDIDVAEIARSTLVETLVNQAVEVAREAERENACKCVCKWCAIGHPIERQGMTFNHMLRHGLFVGPCQAVNIRRGLMAK